MSNASFFKGMGMGLVVGASVGMAVTPKKKSRNIVGRALRVAGEIADNISDTMMH